mmetsp:Transcript_14040/g.36050  ORF Transcript_14040/g.36050 Transcript_14040/m.36050 type:complete len:84 (-) Transcript_14040:444-695(-)
MPFSTSGSDECSEDGDKEKLYSWACHELGLEYGPGEEDGEGEDMEDEYAWACNQYIPAVARDRCCSAAEADCAYHDAVANYNQ